MRQTWLDLTGQRPHLTTWIRFECFTALETVLLHCILHVHVTRDDCSVMLCIGGAYFSIRMSLCAQRHILCDVVGAYDTLEILTLPDTHLVCLLDYECIGIAETRIRVYIVAYFCSAMPEDWQSSVLSHYQINILRSESGFGDIVKMCS